MMEQTGIGDMVSATPDADFQWKQILMLRQRLALLESGSSRSGGGFVQPWPSDVPMYFGNDNNTNIEYDSTEQTLKFTGNVHIADNVTPPGTPAVALGAAGVPNGDYLYKYTYTTQYGETIAGPQSALIQPAAEMVTVALVLSTNPLVTGWNLYRTENGGSDFYFLTAGTGATYSDNNADGALDLTQPEPAVGSATPTGNLILGDGQQIIFDTAWPNHSSLRFSESPFGFVFGKNGATAFLYGEGDVHLTGYVGEDGGGEFAPSIDMTATLIDVAFHSIDAGYDGILAGARFQGTLVTVPENLTNTRQISISGTTFAGDGNGPWIIDEAVTLEIGKSDTTGDASITDVFALHLLDASLKIGTNGDGHYIQSYEMTAPSNGPANSARWFLRDNGGGKTQFCIIYQSGAVHVLDTET